MSTVVSRLTPSLGAAFHTPAINRSCLFQKLLPLLKFRSSCFAKSYDVTVISYNFHRNLLAKLLWAGDSDLLRPSTQAGACLHVYLTRWRLHSASTIAQR